MGVSRHCHEGTMKAQHIGCCSGKMLILLFASYCLLHVHYLWHSIRPPLKRVSPGMTFDMVLSIIPQRFIRSPKSWNAWIPKDTFMSIGNGARTNAAYYLYITSIPALFTEDEVSKIFFDENDKAIGIYYCSSTGNGYWRPPKWPSNLTEQKPRPHADDPKMQIGSAGE